MESRVYVGTVGQNTWRSRGGGATWEKLAHEFGETRALLWVPRWASPDTDTPRGRALERCRLEATRSGRPVRSAPFEAIRFSMRASTQRWSCLHGQREGYALVQ